MSTTRRDHSIASAVAAQASIDAAQYEKSDTKEIEYAEDPRAARRRQSIEEGQIKYKRLSWQRLTICLIVEAIALGSLSLPRVFAVVGMVAGVLLTVGIGLLSMYTGYLVGMVKLKYPHVEHYADAMRLIWGRFGYELSSVMFVLLLILITGSHVLTGTIAWNTIVGDPSICALVWGVISAILLFCLSIPPSFHEFAILGYIDFVSIVAAILVTMIATGIESNGGTKLTGAADWTVWPPEGVTFVDGFLATTNVVFAYSYTVTQHSFMAEMHTPEDFMKSIYSLVGIEIFIYTLTGSLIYAFAGSQVQSPALLSASPTVSRVAFGISLPVLFISGAINSTVVGRYIVGRAFRFSEIRYTNTTRGWIVWLILLVIITVIAWVIAEAVPFFSDLLGLISSLFLSGFTWYFPPLFWFYLLKEGKWYHGWKNICLSLANAGLFGIGLTILVGGTYASVRDILHNYSTGKVGGSFTCDSSAY